MSGLPKLPGLAESLPGLVAPPPGGDVTLPGVPGAPAVPGIPALPGRILPAPGAAVPQLGGAAVPAAEAQGPVGRSEATEVARAGASVRARADEHRDVLQGRSVPTHPTRRAGHTAAPAAHVEPSPSGRAPGSRSDGTFGNRVAADGGGPRPGDAHAVTPGHRAPMQLLAVLAVRGEAAGTRDSHRDIPLFPG
ncbi:hypothetical protein [Streptomyces sp. NPDC058735]|uniref:hypothetical protein n=1 Tax=unclassified Streptomyces TaxID=2593676 RepID=UPI00367E4CF5